MNGIKVISRNKKALHDYHIDETYEAGLVLQGTEVKSLRRGKASLRDSYAMVEKGEAFLYNAYIGEYEQGNRFNHDPRRTRKLLLHKDQINRLGGLTQSKGYTIVPLQIYFKQGKAKVELALAKGKTQYDKRRALAERDEKRRIQRALSERNR